MRILFLAFILSLTFSANTTAQEAVNSTLQNTTVKSIPLWIPSVMNPNLSPLSKSGVTLKVGQKIYFRHKLKRRLLLEVVAENKGQTLNVAKLIRQRKKELG